MSGPLRRFIVWSCLFLLLGGPALMVVNGNDIVDLLLGVLMTATGLAFAGVLIADRREQGGN